MDEGYKKKVLCLAVFGLILALAAYSFAQTLQDTKLDTPPTPCTNSTFLQSFSGTSTICNIVPLSGTLSYFFDNQTSVNTVNASKRMLTTPNSTEFIITYNNVPNNQTIQNWTTKQGTPNMTFIPAGDFVVHLHASSNKANSVMVYTEIWEVNNTGVYLNLIGTTEHETLTTTEAEYSMVYHADNTTFLNSSSSRVMAQIFTHVFFDSPDVTLYYGGTADSKLTFPSQTVDASNFVPYNGATNNLAMGVFNITANNISTNSGISLDSLESEKVNKSGDRMTGALNIKTTNNSRPFTVENSDDSPIMQFINDDVGNASSLNNPVICIQIGQNTTVKAFLLCQYGNNPPASKLANSSVFNFLSAASLIFRGNAVNRFVFYPNGSMIVESENITMRSHGKGTIYESPDGTQCGFVGWSDAGTLLSESIPCP